MFKWSLTALVCALHAPQSCVLSAEIKTVALWDCFSQVSSALKDVELSHNHGEWLCASSVVAVTTLGSNIIFSKCVLCSITQAHLDFIL